MAGCENDDGKESVRSFYDAVEELICNRVKLVTSEDQGASVSVVRRNRNHQNGDFIVYVPSRMRPTGAQEVGVSEVNARFLLRLKKVVVEQNFN
jgi:hypothetical protein